jgi:hypothetical protein
LEHRILKKYGLSFLCHVVELREVIEKLNDLKDLLLNLQDSVGFLADAIIEDEDDSFVEDDDMDIEKPSTPHIKDTEEYSITKKRPRYQN